MRAHDVAVEHLDDAAAPLELLREAVPDRALARAREAGKPDGEAGVGALIHEAEW